MLREQMSWGRIADSCLRYAQRSPEARLGYAADSCPRYAQHLRPVRAGSPPGRDCEHQVQVVRWRWRHACTCLP